MTHILSIDPGKNTGAALGFYDALTPYRLLQRWQIHDGLEGFAGWWETAGAALIIDEIVVERFVLDPNNQFTADLTPKEIEGYLRGVMSPEEYAAIIWQLRSDKALLTGYPPTASTKAKRQRVRFDFLDRFGMFKKGSENDDSNDAITHALVSLKKRKHYPSLMAFWAPRPA